MDTEQQTNAETWEVTDKQANAEQQTDAEQLTDAGQSVDIEQPADAEQQATDEVTIENIIPIETIDPQESTGSTGNVFMPRALDDDPFTGDGSTNRDGVGVSVRRLHTLPENRLGSLFEPTGTDAWARNVRRVHEQSRKSRDGVRRKRRKYIRVAVGFLVVAAFIGLAYVGATYALEMWGGIRIPYVMGDTQTKATQLLEEKGFTVSTQEQVSDTMEGHVIAVEPAQGKRVEEGTHITLTISTPRIMPEVVGQTRDEARNTLMAAGAKAVRYETRTSMVDNDKIVESRPAAGALFMSTEEVTLVVAELPVVPNVVGEEADLAMTHMERSGVPAHVELERANPEDRGRVIRTSPQADENVGEEGVTVFVGDSLIQVTRLSDYFDAKGAHIVEFLQAEGYAPKMGHISYDGHLLARFANGDDVSVSFANEPWSQAVMKDQTPYQQVINDQTKLEGVRLTMPIKTTTSTVTEKQANGKQVTKTITNVLPILGIENPAVDEQTAQNVRVLCGFGDAIGSCTQTDIALPAGVGRQNTPFYCCYGEVGKYVWTVLIKGTTAKDGKVTATEIVATCVPKSAYAEVDLKSSGEKVCDYVAYQDMYKG